MNNKEEVRYMNGTLYLKKIPNTSPDNYISGLEALNLKTNLHDSIDWHRLGILYSHNQDDILTTFKANKILGNSGIIEQHILLANKQSFIAKPSRAIVDLILSIFNSSDTVYKKRRLNMLRGDIYNLFPNDLDRKNIASLLIKAINATNSKELNEFFKREMPKEFFKYTYKGEQYEYCE